MKLNKNRHFEALVTDTFKYMGHVWQHFIPTMLRVNIIYLAAVFFMTYFAITLSYGAIDFMPSIINGSPKLDFDIDKLKMILSGWKITAFLLLYILFIIGFVIFEAFTPTYMILQNRLGRVPTYNEIVSFIKENAGRLIVFCLWCILMSIPLIVIIILGSIMLAITLVGIVLIPVFILVIGLISSLLLFTYLDNERIGFFDALDIAWKRLKSHFFRYIGSSLIIYIIGAIAVSIPKNLLSNAFEVSYSSVFLGIMFALLSLFIHFIISAFYSVNAGLIYFSSNPQNTDYSDDALVE